MAFLFIYHHIIKNDKNLRDFEALIAHISYNKVIIVLTLIILLMTVNWVLEALKWRRLTRELAPMSIWQSIESVFCGLTWAIFTPNRLGEYGGRVMFLPNRKRLYGVFAMAVGSFGQNVVTNVLGAGALVWFLYNYMHLNIMIMAGIASMSIVFIVLMLLFYFHIKWMVSLLNSINFLKKFHRFFNIMGKYKTAELLNVMWFCIARFSVFTFQYYLIIHLLVPQIPILPMTLLMFVFFFISSAIPSIDLLDIGVRSFTAGTLFGYVTHQTIAVVVSVSLIYVTNMIIPAILGSFFVFKLKFFDRAA
jgi:hypothetical protein